MMYLGESLFDRHELAVRAGCHVAASQNAGKHVRRRLKLETQEVGKSAFFGFDDGVEDGALGGFQQIGLRAENRCQAACPGGDALDVRPAAGERLVEECLGEMFGPGSQRVRAAQAGQPGQDVHGRDMP